MTASTCRSHSGRKWDRRSPRPRTQVPPQSSIRLVGLVRHPVGPRLPLEDIELSTGTVPAYADLFLVLAAANRDPRQFEDPQRFVIARPNNRHLGFGFGIHHCVGAPLSRIEGEEVFGRVAQRFSRIELVQDPPSYKDNVSLPGVAALDIELTT